MSELWAITPYFSPAGFRSRRRNFRVFRARLEVPLVAVELSFHGGFELAAGDADILIQIRGADVMWQKERLINLGVGAVPAACTKIAWLDGDVVFRDAGWSARASRALDEFALIQPYSSARDLERREDLDAALGESASSWTPSFAAHYAQGHPIDPIMQRTDAGWQRVHTPGFAWAARRELLAAHGLYDACIMGAGDRALLSAAVGDFDGAARALHMSPALARHYERWARPFHAAVQGRVGCAASGLVHLWHGHLDDRQYRVRHAGFRGFEFDPVRDLAHADSGCWRWSSPRPAMHRYLQDFFRARREDGREEE